MAEKSTRQKYVDRLLSSQRTTTNTLSIAILGAQMPALSGEKPSGEKAVFVPEVINALLLHKRFIYQFITDFSSADAWLFVH